MSNARLVAFKALIKVNHDNGYSNLVINHAIKNSDLSSLDASLATLIFYGVLERKITIDYIISLYSKIPLKKLSKDVVEILRIGVYQILYMDKIPDSAAVNECVKLAKANKNYKSSGFINAVLRNIIRKYKLDSKNKNDELANKVDILDFQTEDHIKFLSLKYSCSEWLVKMWIESYGERATQEILKSTLGRPNLIARVNTLKNSPEELIHKLEKRKIKSEILFDDLNAIALQNTGSIENIEEFKNGDFHIQDVSSQICCEALQVQQGGLVVDVCSAPGGKSFTIAELMQNRGQIFSFDLHDSKISLIRDGAKRLGISIITASVRDAENDSDFKIEADRILCDVPCSGFGIIRRKPEIKYKEEKSFEDLPEIQYNILCNSSKLLKIGGILIYSTCTLNHKENKNVVEKFLNRYNNFSAIKVNVGKHIKRNSWEPESQLTLMPGIYGNDGFFISAIQRVK